MEQKTVAADCDGMEMPEAMEPDRTDLSGGSEGTLRHSDSYGSILILNDDCLLGVFSHLSDFDLCAISDTCRRLSTVATESFRFRYEKRDFDIIIENAVLDPATSTILKHFGQLIRSIRIDFYESEESNWQFISKNCSSFTKMSITCKPLENVSEAFKKLMTKNVFKPKQRTPIEILEEMARTDVKKLFLIINNFDFELFFDCQKPSMENFSCFSAFIKACSEDSVKTFLRTNPQLTKFRSMGLLQFDTNVTRYMENIEHLCLVQSMYYHGSPPFNIELNALNKLKCLELYHKYDGAIVARKLNSLHPQIVNQLECLGIPATLLSADFVETICKFNNLKSLKIGNHPLVNETVIGVIAGQLEQLEYLELGLPVHFETIHAVIERSAKLKSLMILHDLATIVGAQFLQLIDARKKSNAKYPLVIYFNDPNQMSESFKKWNHLRQRHINVIQFKNGVCPVLAMNFFADPYPEIFPRISSN